MKETQLTALASRILHLTESNRKLQLGLTRHEVVNQKLETEAKSANLLLAESRNLEKNLQEMTRHIVLAKESGRKAMSLRLQDDIVQTLESIHLRLLHLSKEVCSSSEDFKKEVANTQDLVQQSVRVINSFAEECGIQHEN
jgi:signal transduction histidine kinase